MKQRGIPAQTAAVSQQADSDQSKSASSQQEGGLPPEESHAPSSITERTHDDTSGSSPSSAPICEI